MTSTDRVGIVGTGMIGTSIAMAAARAGAAVRGFDIDADVLVRAAGRTELAPAETMDACLAGSTLVFVCTPVPTVAERVLRGAAARARGRRDRRGEREVAGSVEITGSASVEELRRYVGGHPMGGSERSGPEHASPSVLDGIVWVLDEQADGDSTDRVEAFVRSVGARPVRMDVDRHDRLVAIVSHLPQVASTALMGLAATEEAGEPEILLLAAGGFRDLTRLAASNPHLWGDILLANGDAVARAIDLYVERLSTLRELVAAGDGQAVERAFGDAKEARLSLAAKPQVKAGVAVLQVPVPDRPGVLAEVTATMSDAGVNIEDLQIVHSPEGGRGTVHLTVAAGAADDAEHALRERWFEPLRLA